MKKRQTLRVHNAMVIDQMQCNRNQLCARKRLGRKPRPEVREDRNALALRYIESGRIGRFSATHKIVVPAT
jgi:hypothetical protein